MEQRVKMTIAALANSERQNNGYIVVLKEEGGNRRLPIVIGHNEAQSLAMALEGVSPNRPLTHDLFHNVLKALRVELEEVLVAELKGGVFYARMICVQPDGERIEVDSRTSDALAMAVRFGCPIFAHIEVLDEAGMTMEQEPPRPTAEPPSSTSIQDLSASELSERLHKAIEAENYELAARIRDEQARRDSSSS